MADTKAEEKVQTDAPVRFGGAYKESDEHVPDPTALYDQMNTSGTGSHHVIEDISPVFDIAKKEAAIQAGRAIDPDDDGVPASAVVLPDNDVPQHEALKEQIRKRAAAAADSPVVVGGPGPSERQAAESGDEGAALAADETANQGTQSAGEHAGSDASGEPKATHHAGAGNKPASKPAESKSGDNK